MHTFITNLVFLSIVLFLGWITIDTAVAHRVLPIQPTKKNKRISKKAYRKQLKTARKFIRLQKKSNTKQSPTQLDQIQINQFIPNAWFPVGITLLVIGAIMALLFGAPVSYFGAAIAFIGFCFLIVWVFQEINRSY